MPINFRSPFEYDDTITNVNLYTEEQLFSTWKNNKRIDMKQEKYRVVRTFRNWASMNATRAALRGWFENKDAEGWRGDELLEEEKESIVSSAYIPVSFPLL